MSVTALYPLVPPAPLEMKTSIIVGIRELEWLAQNLPMDINGVVNVKPQSPLMNFSNILTNMMDIRRIARCVYKKIIMTISDTIGIKKNCIVFATDSRENLA